MVKRENQQRRLAALLWRTFIAQGATKMNISEASLACVAIRVKSSSWERLSASGHFPSVIVCRLPTRVARSLGRVSKREMSGKRRLLSQHSSVDTAEKWNKNRRRAEPNQLTASRTALRTGLLLLLIVLLLTNTPNVMGILMCAYLAWDAKPKRSLKITAVFTGC